MNDAKNSQTASRSVLGDREFRLFASGHGVSALGDAVNQTALPLLVLHLTRSGMQMGLVAMLQALPMLVLGFPAGVLVDRWDRRRIMLWCDVGRAILVACIPLSAWLGLDTLSVLYAIVVPLGILFVLFDAASPACIPALVGRERLAEANAYLSLTTSVGYVAGPGLAGVLAASIGAAYTLGIDAVTFAISTLSLVLIRRPLQLPRTAATSTMMAGIKEGFAFIYRHKALRALLAYWALVGFVIAPIVVCVTFYITKDLGMSERALGSVVSLYAIGSVIGSLIGARIPPSFAGYAILGGITIGGLALITLGNIDILWLALLIAFVAGGGDAIAIVFYITIRASMTPDHLLGRVISIARVLTFGLQPLSLFLCGLLLDAVGGSVTLWLMGGMSLAISTVFWLIGDMRTILSSHTHDSDPAAS